MICKVSRPITERRVCAPSDADWHLVRSSGLEGRQSVGVPPKETTAAGADCEGSWDVKLAAMAPSSAKIRCDNHYRIERKQNMAWCSDISDGGEAFDIGRWWPCLFSGELRPILDMAHHRYIVTF